MVNGVIDDVVDGVLQHYGESEIGLPEEGGVSGDILAEIPKYSIGGGLGSAGAEELRAGEPDGGDATVWRPTGGGGEVKDGV